MTVEVYDKLKGIASTYPLSLDSWKDAKILVEIIFYKQANIYSMEERFLENGTQLLILKTLKPKREIVYQIKYKP